MVTREPGTARTLSAVLVLRVLGCSFLCLGVWVRIGGFGCVVERVFVWVWVCPEAWTEIEVCLLCLFEGNWMSWPRWRRRMVRDHFAMF